MIGQTAPTSDVDRYVQRVADMERRIAELEQLAARSATTAVVNALAKPTAWVAVTFQNGWVDFVGTHQLCQYRKIGDNVQIRGLVKSGTVGAGFAIFVLPAGFRPPLDLNIATVSNGLFGQVQINQAGWVQAIVGSNAWFSLNDITFSTV